MVLRGLCGQAQSTGHWRSLVGESAWRKVSRRQRIMDLNDNDSYFNVKLPLQKQCGCPIKPPLRVQ